MPFHIKSRYGASEEFGDGADIAAIVDDLIRELETEEFDEPDDEHTQVAVSNDDWAVTVEVSGLMTLSDMRLIPAFIKDPSIELPDELHIRARSRQEAVDMLSMMAREEIDAIRAAPWLPYQQVPRYRGHLFRAPQPWWWWRLLVRFRRIHSEFGMNAVLRTLLLLVGLPMMAVLGIVLFSSPWAAIIATVGLALGVLLRRAIVEGIDYYARAIPAGIVVYAVVIFLGDRFGLHPEARLLIVTATTVVIFDFQFWSLSDP